MLCLQQTGESKDSYALSLPNPLTWFPRTNMLFRLTPTADFVGPATLFLADCTCAAACSVHTKEKTELTVSAT